MSISLLISGTAVKRSTAHRHRVCLITTVYKDIEYVPKDNILHTQGNTKQYSPVISIQASQVILGYLSEVSNQAKPNLHPSSQSSLCEISL